MTALPPLVEALMQGGIYPEKPSSVTLVQTQMSFVFLLGDYVYKLKKPVKFGFVDFSTLEKRRLYCEQEVNLNRRLSPQVYLGVTAITREDGGYTFDGTGEVVECAVKMRQLPLDRCLDKLLDKDEVTPEMMTDVAERLVKFHSASRLEGELSRYGDVEIVAQNVRENFDQVREYIELSLSRETYDAIAVYANNFIAKETPLFRKRVKEGKVRDCHGDLHSEHICFTDEIHIFDCIEFNDRFRYCDVASEIAFLAMDIDFHRHTELSDHFVNEYMRISGDHELLRLLNFYKCYRAYVRGKVESFELDDPGISEEQKSTILRSASSYFRLAETYTTPQ